MNINLSHVHTFLVVVEAGNLNKAATRLNVTQSTVTARINALEDTIGQRLLKRTKSGAELTPAGTRFMRHAKVMVEVWKQARHDTSLPKGFDDICNIGCVDALWEVVGERWVNELRARCPTIALNIQCGSESETHGWTASSIVDVAISFQPPISSGYSVDVLFEDEYIEVATVARELMRWDPMYVYVDHGEAFRRWHAISFPVEETAVVAFNNSRQALAHIFAWSGSAYLPRRLVDPLIEEGRLFPVNDAPRFTRTCFIARNNGRTEKWDWLGDLVETLKADLGSTVN